jgi:transcriptional regulator with XRE-family HTH domain
MAILTPPSFGDYLRHLRSVAPTGSENESGLNRTQLAARSDLSAGYIIKLEQGKVDRPSPEVIDRLATNLGITAVERQHLHDLALQPQLPPERIMLGEDAKALITPVMTLAADNMHPHLCGYVDEMWNVLYCNAEYSRIYRGISEIGNVLKWFFFVPESRLIMAEWDVEARLTVAWFRALMVRRSKAPVFVDLLQELAQSPEFSEMWLRREVSMSRHSPFMTVHDLDNGMKVTLLAQVYPLPDPTNAVQMYLGIKNNEGGTDTYERPSPM